MPVKSQERDRLIRQKAKPEVTGSKLNQGLSSSTHPPCSPTCVLALGGRGSSPGLGVAGQRCRNSQEQRRRKRIGTETEREQALAGTELNYTLLAPMAGQRPRVSAPGPSFGAGEDEAGPLPQRDGPSPSVDETLGTWGQLFISTPINLTTAPCRPTRGSPGMLLVRLRGRTPFPWQHKHRNFTLPSYYSKEPLLHTTRTCRHAVSPRFARPYTQPVFGPLGKMPNSEAPTNRGLFFIFSRVCSLGINMAHTKDAIL